MKICKYAFDKSDELCATCNGINYMDEGVEKMCTECPGYEAGDKESEQSKPEVKTEEKEVKKEETIKEKPKQAETVKCITEEVKKGDVEIDDLSKYGVKVKSIRYQSSRTVKVNDDYFKFSAEEEWEVENAKAEDSRIISDMLWAKLNEEVDKQVKEI